MICVLIRFLIVLCLRCTMLIPQRGNQLENYTTHKPSKYYQSCCITSVTYWQYYAHKHNMYYNTNIVNYSIK